MKFVFMPFSIALGLAAGMVGSKIFEQVWGLVDEDEPPHPQHRETGGGAEARRPRPPPAAPAAPRDRRAAEADRGPPRRGRDLPARPRAGRPQRPPRLRLAHRLVARRGAPRAGVAP